MEYDDENLPFAKAEVVRLMKEVLPKNRWITDKVKVEMNMFLYEILKNICEKLAREPYATINYAMLKEALMSYEMLGEIEAEKTRIIRSLEKIKSDCDVMIEAVERKFVSERKTKEHNKPVKDDEVPAEKIGKSATDEEE